jgi:hypothetical protein
MSQSRSRPQWLRFRTAWRLSGRVQLTRSSAMRLLGCIPPTARSGRRPAARHRPPDRPLGATHVLQLDILAPLAGMLGDGVRTSLGGGSTLVQTRRWRGPNCWLQRHRSVPLPPCPVNERRSWWIHDALRTGVREWGERPAGAMGDATQSRPDHTKCPTSTAFRAPSRPAPPRYPRREPHPPHHSQRERVTQARRPAQQRG